MTSPMKLQVILKVSAGVLAAAAIVVTMAVYLGADATAILLVLAAAPPATLFSLIYGTTSRWWRTLVGRALFTSSFALALLVDISLLYQWLGDDYYLRDVVRLTVFSLIAAGAWMKFLALIAEKWHARRNDHQSSL